MSVKENTSVEKSMGFGQLASAARLLAQKMTFRIWTVSTDTANFFFSDFVIERDNGDFLLSFISTDGFGSHAISI